MKNIVCPVSDQRVDEHAARMGALVTIGIVASAFVLNSGLLLVILMADFFIRALGEAKLSPVAYAGQRLARALALPGKSTDKAPKVFAARLGLLMTTAVTMLFGFGLRMASVALGSVLVLFAGLEFLCGVCVGCLIYTYVVLPFVGHTVPNSGT